jgi:hypothetical protein
MNRMSSCTNNPANFERRSGIDRRKRRPPFFSKYWLTGRRGAHRRKDDRQRFCDIDRYNYKILAAILLIIALSTLDAIFTLVLVSRGAEEVNPFMAYYLDRSPLLFFWVKYLMTCASIILILFSTNTYLFKTKIQAKTLFFLVPIPFVLVVQWQVRLILSGF